MILNLNEYKCNKNIRKGHLEIYIFDIRIWRECPYKITTSKIEFFANCIDILL